MSEPRILEGLGSIAEQYDAFILDQWGVLHNGKAPYPGVVDALRTMREGGKKICLLTNSGRRARMNRERLDEMGFPPDSYDGLITSGEAAWLGLRGRKDPRLHDLGHRAVLITRDNDFEVVEDLGLTLTSDPAQADFVYLAGVDSPPKTLDDYAPLLASAQELGLPMICSNPDRIAVSADGLLIAPGTIAAHYEELGGRVYYFGKPNRPIYEACLEVLAGVDPARILCVGDSLEHDIAGAVGMGMDSCFVMQGIHADHFPEDLPADRLAVRVRELAERYETSPLYAIHRTTW
ncbi:TIGR01459 family HAD-type hydrolase [Geminicoccus roseus]|uniref:TIGR01459 family HAD-type hydrolase n=1 Tax=Geminicoccus roseus TaxID=404900 RepID=UPI0004158907|nr:TIGR01459 family HAD-type hydrolase [Geminicoccus roseus]